MVLAMSLQNPQCSRWSLKSKEFQVYDKTHDGCLNTDDITKMNLNEIVQVEKIINSNNSNCPEYKYIEDNKNLIIAELGAQRNRLILENGLSNYFNKLTDVFK